MKSAKLKLVSIADVRDFVNKVNSNPCEIDLSSGRYVVDAKSIMGIFSLDLTRPIGITVHGTDEQCAKFLEDIKDYVVD